jgi:hypothetical protein
MYLCGWQLRLSDEEEKARYIITKRKGSEAGTAARKPKVDGIGISFVPSKTQLTI